MTSFCIRDYLAQVAEAIPQIILPAHRNRMEAEAKRAERALAAKTHRPGHCLRTTYKRPNGLILA